MKSRKLSTKPARWLLALAVTALLGGYLGVRLMKKRGLLRSP